MIKKNMLVFILIIFFINKLLPLYAQNSTSDVSEVFGEGVLDILKGIEESRVKEQSKILSLDDLPGSFWVTIEPYEIGGRFYFDGYIFLKNNCILDVLVEADQTIDVLRPLSISPILYITVIRGAMTYVINDDKIIFMNEIFFYLENTDLYALKSDKYIKCRLESRFSLWHLDPIMSTD